GQKMSWDSKKMGKGAMTIAEVKPYESVAYNLDFGGAKAKASFNIQPIASGSKVTWRMESQSGFNPIERVMNLVMKSFIVKDFDSGLAKLKILAEELPDVDLDGLTVSSAQLNARPFIYVPVEVSDADPVVAQSEILRGMNKANAVLILNDMAPSGPGVVQFVGKENGMIQAHAGFPIDKAPTMEEAAGLVGSAKVVFGEVPGGAMIRAPSAAKAGDKVFKQLEVYMKLMRLQPRGDVQQAYPAGPNGDTEIFIPIG
ncbi:MAG: SRPBCC family protein, partial [Caulobacterales bacterium]